MKNLFVRIMSTRCFLVFSMILYRFSLDIVFINIISKYYAYAGFILDVNHIKVLESYILILIFSLLLKHTINKPSDFLILFLYSMIIVPLSSIYSLQDKAREFFYYMNLSFIVITIFSKARSIKTIRIKNGDRFVIVFTLLTGVLLFGWITMRGGFGYLNFNLFKVYDFRRKVAELIFPGYLAYLMNWFGKVLNPFFIAFSLWKRNKTGIVISISAQALFFGITAHKAMLFYPIIILFVYVASKKTNFAQMVPFGLVAINFVSIMLFKFNKSLTLISLFPRRVLLLTAKIHYTYYEFFKERGFLYYSNRGWFPKIIEYPYTLPVQLVVNQGKSEGWANTGFLANGYIHFGFIGMLAYSIIVGLIFSQINSVSDRYLPVWLCIGIMVIPIFSLVSADLPTTLLNNGILVALLVLWLMSGSLSESNK